jgi:divalent metal cation (Fe/Co/Zn/Cd) transporter
MITVIWMALEAGLALGAGIAARSVLLTAFGADSLIELLSGATLWWRLRRDSAAAGAEKTATRVSAALLVLLCAYVLLSSVGGLVLRFEPQPSLLGVAVAALAVVIMPWLAQQKRVVNSTLQSPALRADVAESVTCAYLAGVTLIGVAVDALTGLWWVEYLAALALLRWLIPEALEALEASR